MATGITDGFELAGSASPDVDADAPDPGATLGVSDPAYGPVDQFDHLVVSLFAVGLAAGLGRPVTVETAAADDGRFDYRITCSWEPEAA